MDQPVDGGRRGHRIVKDGLPLGKGQIAGDQDRSAFVAMRQECKEDFHLFAGVLDIADVVEDEGMILVPALQQPGEGQVAFGESRFVRPPALQYRGQTLGR